MSKYADVTHSPRIRNFSLGNVPGRFYSHRMKNQRMGNLEGHGENERSFRNDHIRADLQQYSRDVEGDDDDDDDDVVVVVGGGGDCVMVRRNIR